VQKDSGKSYSEV